MIEDPRCTIIVPIFKKLLKFICNNNKNISLLSATRKVISDVLLDDHLSVTEELIPNTLLILSSSDIVDMISIVH